ncbi:TonB-dependent receptor domain-containing protein [Sinimarinibacterium thermocellulolyticum]|uniref:TonB-dependent receptor n=1 Tax=Sinimarinibacterium thermocellulolyticum TaxID=3170016 RepID=A0ABV2AEF9_9GAMM
MRCGLVLAGVLYLGMTPALRADEAPVEPDDLPTIALPAPPAEAADAPAPAAPDPSVVELPPQVVVGTRDPREIDELTSSVSVIGARQIEYSGASSVGELLAELPGVAVEGGPRPEGAFVNVRGLSGPRVLLVVDGARQNFLGGHRSSLLVDPEMLKQVEMLRGPASALWGSDALGGVVVFTTKDARDFLAQDERAGGRVRAGFGSVSDERMGSGVGALRLGELDFVASAVRRESSDYERGDGEVEPHTGLAVDSHLAKLSWLPPTRPHRLSIVHQGYAQSGRSPSNPATRISDTNPLVDRRNDVGYTVARYGFGEGTGWLRHAQLDVYRDALDIREDRVDEPRADRSEFRTDGANGHVTVVLEGDRLADLLLSLGVDGFRDRSRATRDGAPRPQFPDAQRRLAGTFAQAELRFEAFSLVSGIRYDRYRSTTNQTDDAAVVESAVSPKFGLVWRLTDGLHLRAAYNGAFRAPGLIEIFASGQHFLGNDFVPNPELRPEKARNVELGWSLDLPGFAAGQQALLSGSLYRNRIRDFIELAVTVESEFPAARCISPMPPVGCVNRGDDGRIDPLLPPVFVGGSTTSKNLDAATIYGGELETAYRVGPLQLGASYSHTRGRDEGSGQPLSNIPADRLRVNLDWRTDLAGSLRTTLAFTRHFGQQRVPVVADENGEPQALVPATPAYGVWDLGWSWEPFGSGRRFGLVAPRLVLGIDNLTDTSYRDHLNVLPSPGRNLRASLSFGF